MGSRGISPLLAVVLLVSFAFIVGIVVLSSSVDTVEKQNKDVEELFERSLIVRFNALYGDSECDENELCDSEAEQSSCYDLLVENTEGFDVNYLVKTFSDTGMDLCGPVEVPAYYSRVITVRYNSETVGIPNEPPGFGVWADIVAIQ